MMQRFSTQALARLAALLAAIALAIVVGILVSPVVMRWRPLMTADFPLRCQATMGRDTVLLPCALFSAVAETTPPPSETTTTTRPPTGR